MDVSASVKKQKKVQGSILIWFLIILCTIALCLIVYNIIFGNYWYAASYLLGIVLGLSFILVQYSALFSTWIAVDGDSVVLRCFDNCFFPYQTLLDVKFFGELLPSKHIRLKVPIEDIKNIFIGTKTFIKRNANDNAFLEAVALYENSKSSSNKRILEKSDMIYIGTVDNDSVFMSVNDFDEKSLVKILNVVRKQNADVLIKANGRQYRKFMTSSEN